jgi:hypothetical protein
LQRCPARNWVIDPHNPPIRQIHALRGHAGQPGPRAENRERGKRRRDGNRAIAFPSVPECHHSADTQKSKLVVAIAKGVAISKWARENSVPNRTAYRWASDPRVRARVEKCRRRALDRAIGKMSHSVNWAALGIKKLAETAASESVKLTALRTIFSNMMAISEFAELQDRINQLEEQLHVRERDGHTGQAG